MAMDSPSYPADRKINKERAAIPMSKTPEVLLFLSRAVVTGLAVAFLVIYFWPTMAERLQRPTAEDPSPTAAAPASYAEAVNRAAPAVVSIYTRSLQPQSTDPNPNIRGGGFRYLYRMEHDMGSGVIVSEDGYILTNHHVVNMVQNIRIALFDGRIVPATIVGSDPETDLAVLKVDLANLPAIAFGNPQGLSIGDFVLAIGNPFGVGQTVTMGIVSGKNRSRLGISTFENFIQTDAAINPGNSGGALVDAAGNLVGINSAIYSRTGGSLGIGFAIPSDLARQVMEQIIQTGSVTRGWIGVEVQDISPELAESFNLPTTNGTLIAGVQPGGPAERAGVRRGDILIGVESQTFTDATEMLNLIAALKPGERATLQLLRDREEMAVQIQVGTRPRPMRGKNYE